MQRLFCLLLFIPGLVFAKTKTIQPAITETYFRYVIGTLAHDSMKGRLPGTAEETKAANFIAAEMKKAGCKPFSGNYFSPFSYTGPDSVTQIRSAGNVISRIDTKSEYAIVISAHYDHIGMGKFHSKTPFTSGVYNGADDNASGVAMLLAMAGWCREHRKELKTDIIFVAFSGEEDGLYGSEYFIRNSPVDTSRILCNLNFDMIGRLDIPRPVLRVDAALEYSAWDSCLPPDSAKGFNVLRRENMIEGGADHCSFLHYHIPAVLFTTGLHSEYHTPSDDIDKINFSGMIYIGNYMTDILHLINRRKRPESIFLR